MKFKFRFEDRGLEKKLKEMQKKGQFALDSQVLKDSNFYAPKDEGALIESGIRFTNLGSGMITWQTPYARRLYYNPQYDFSTDKNPNAGGLWFETAKSRHIKEWEKIVKQAL